MKCIIAQGVIYQRYPGNENIFANYGAAKKWIDQSPLRAITAPGLAGFSNPAFIGAVSQFYVDCFFIGDLLSRCWLNLRKLMPKSPCSASQASLKSRGFQVGFRIFPGGLHTSVRWVIFPTSRAFMATKYKLSICPERSFKALNPIIT